MKKLSSVKKCRQNGLSVLKFLEKKRRKKLKFNKSDYPKNYLQILDGDIFEKTYNKELLLIITSDKDIEYSSALKIAREKIKELLNCKNYFKVQVLESIIFDLIIASGIEFENLKKDVWKSVMQAQPYKYFDIENGVLKKYNGKWKCLSIPEGVKKVEERFFDDYDDYNYILEVEMPESLREIGYAAFCRSDIKSVKFGNNIKIIKQNTFSESSLRKAAISESIEEIERNAFEHCRSLTEVIFIGKKKKIDNCAFDGCYDVKTVRFIGKAEELEDIKKDLYTEIKCFRGSDFGKWGKKWTEKRLKGFPSVGLDELEIVFQVEE